MTPPRFAAQGLTIQDVADRAGVSKKTVSRVINDSPLVKPDTRAKVHALMREYGYAPDPQARSAEDAGGWGHMKSNERLRCTRPLRCR